MPLFRRFCNLTWFSINLTSLGMDLKLVVRSRRDEEIFSVRLVDRVHCLGDVTEYDGGRGPTGFGAASLVSANTRRCYLIL